MLPVEMKSGFDFKKYSALNRMPVSPSYGIEHAIVFSIPNILQEGKILYIIYLLKQNTQRTMICKLDLKEM
jgi:hypothetical protein